MEGDKFNCFTFPIPFPLFWSLYLGKTSLTKMKSLFYRFLWLPLFLQAEQSFNLCEIKSYLSYLESDSNLISIYLILVGRMEEWVTGLPSQHSSRLAQIMILFKL